MRDETFRTDKYNKPVELGEVFRVWTHKVPNDKNYCVCDVIIYDAIPLNPNQMPPNGPAVRLRVPVMQRSLGNCSGTPWTPRVGDLVVILFYKNNRPLIIGTLYNKFQRPVCRDSANFDSKEGNYDVVVLGHRGVGKMREILLGSISEKVAHTVPCTVIIVK